MAGRTIAIGDIHGCDRPLTTLLALLEITPDDTVVLLGDLCDRGPNSCGVIECLIDLSHRCNLRLVLGNHDEMFLGVIGSGFYCDRSMWYAVGGEQTIGSYGGALELIPQSHIDFLTAGLDYFEAGNDLCVHASVEQDLPPDLQDASILRWKKIRGTEPEFFTGQRIICGHTSQRSGQPLLWPGWVCIDTRVFETGWLTALDCGCNRLYQAHESGETRGPVALPEPV